MTKPPKTWKQLNENIKEVNERLREQLEWFKEYNKRNKKNK
jgi:phage-related tail protein